jgi:hypothetical protein
MPAVSEKQKRFMDAAAHNPAFAKAAGIPVATAKEFSEKSKGMKFGKGAPSSRAEVQAVNKSKTDHGSSALFSKGGKMKSDSKEDMAMDKKQDKAMIKKAFKQHDAQEHKGGKGTTLKLAKGGDAKYMKFSDAGKPMGMAPVKKMAAGGAFRSSANGVASKGKTKATQIKMCGGGMYKGK